VRKRVYEARDELIREGLVVQVGGTLRPRPENDHNAKSLKFQMRAGHFGCPAVLQKQGKCPAMSRENRAAGHCRTSKISRKHPNGTCPPILRLGDLKNIDRPSIHGGQIRRHLNESQRTMIAAKLATMPLGANQHTGLQICLPNQKRPASLTSRIVHCSRPRPSSGTQPQNCSMPSNATKWPSVQRFNCKTTAKAPQCPTIIGVSDTDRKMKHDT
jgi:hypothetical protein